MQYKYFHIYKEWASSHFLIAKGIIEETEYLFPAKCDLLDRFNLGSGYSCFSHCASSFHCFPSLSAFFLSLSHLPKPLYPSCFECILALGTNLDPGCGVEADAVSPNWVHKRHLTTILSEGW